MTDYHVYGVGNALVDIEFQIDDATLQSLNVDKGLMTLIEEDRHHELLAALGEATGKPASGGSAANTVIACAQLGAKAFYSCKVADDAMGSFYLKDLAACSVASNLSDGQRDAGVTGKCIVLITPDAERSMNTYLGITRELSETELDTRAIAASQYVYIEGYLVPEANARAAAIKATRTAREAGVPTALTLSDENMVRFFRDGLMEIVAAGSSEADHQGLELLFCNEDEACLMFDADELGACIDGLKSLAQRFAITRGAGGALLFDGENLIESPALKVTPVDTNGAGDMYAGAFLYGLTHGMPFATCGELAAEAAGTLITRFGPRLTMTDMQELKARFDNR